MRTHLRNSYVCLILCLSLAIDLTLSQWQRNNRQNNRRRNKGKLEPNQKRMSCYSCYYDMVKNNFDDTNLCYNPAYNMTTADIEILTVCPPATRVCEIAITRTNGVLEIIERRCGPPYKGCHDGVCQTKGYGLEKETCIYCCTGRLLPTDPDFDAEADKNYWCPKDKHWGVY